MPTVVIVRHGQSRANAAGKAGTAGTWLTQKGRGDASRASRNILRDQQGDLSTSVARRILREHGHRKLAVVSSSFRRAKQTAQPLARALGVRVQIQPGVHERDLGALRRKDPATWQDEPGYFTKPGTMQLNPDFRPKDGESLRDVQARAVDGLHDAIHRNPGKDIVLFTHGHTARALEAHIKGTWKGLTNWKNGEHRTFEYTPMTTSKIRESLIEASAHTPVAFRGLINSFDGQLARDMVHSYGSADSAMYALRGLSLKHQQSIPGNIHQLLRDAETKTTASRTPADLPALKYGFGDKVSSTDGQITGRVVGLSRYSKQDKSFMYDVSQDQEPAITSVHPESLLKPITVGKKRRNYNEHVSSLVDRLLEGQPFDEIKP